MTALLQLLLTARQRFEQWQQERLFLLWREERRGRHGP